MAEYRAEVHAGGSVYPCRAELRRWKERAEAVSSAGRESIAGLPDWDGTIYLDGDTQAAIEAAAWAIHNDEDRQLHVDNLEGPFGLVDGDFNAGVLRVQGRGGLKPSG